MQNLALISLFSPFMAFLFASCFALSEKKQFVGIFCSLLVALSTFCSLYLLFCNEAFNVSLFEWFAGVNFGFDIDAISLTMMSVVGIVATCVHFYSIFYMAHDEGFNKFLLIWGFLFFLCFF